MANLKSSKKRVIIGIRNAAVNRVYKTTIKNLLKRYRKVTKLYLSTTSNETFQELKGLVNNLYSRIDKAAKKNVFHLNKSARQKSRILHNLKKLNIPSVFTK
uniref:Ribosomal protein S20 n=1 Tax=Eustigmatophyceae sp. Chic 10/23 P-6w TaxID=1446905 RepID=A0A3R5QN37_9STRA|nr:ribosomal protein S20 [Eustigmatophyceae sp. Chic 10/23 P-6w]QAA11575.1 ribosomal protein S20 [Eustigmatophyceae sp. Chic 10/23 P-6w]